MKVERKFGGREKRVGRVVAASRRLHLGGRTNQTMAMSGRKWREKEKKEKEMADDGGKRERELLNCSTEGGEKKKEREGRERERERA